MVLGKVGSVVFIVGSGCRLLTGDDEVVRFSNEQCVGQCGRLAKELAQASL